MRQKKIIIIDYEMGNIQSVKNAFKHIGCDILISGEPFDINDADGIILPGVGAFGEAMINLKKRNLIYPIKKAVLEKKLPVLGICLGMQLLANGSDEKGKSDGLSLIPGYVRKIPISSDLRLPHVGWNDLSIKIETPLFSGISNKSSFYFVHSYRFECDSIYISATTNYGNEIVAAVQHNNILGVQFHPERSQRIGLTLLNNFVDLVDQSIKKKEA